MKKIASVIVITVLILLSQNSINLFSEELPITPLPEFERYSNELLFSTKTTAHPQSWKNIFKLDCEIGLRYDYFTPEIDIKSDLVKPYYTVKYASDASTGYVGSSTPLERNKTSIPGFALDFKFSPLSYLKLAFSYEIFNEIRADIAGSGMIASLNTGSSDADVITFEKIRLMTLGVNYVIKLHPTSERTRVEYHSTFETIHTIGLEPSFPEIKLNLGLGIQKTSYEATDERTTKTFGATTQVTTVSFSDSVSEIKPVFWFDLDIYPESSFSITLWGRYLNLGGDVSWGGEKTVITFKGLCFGIGARMNF